MKKTEEKTEAGLNTKSAVARLLAVQALYQALHSGQSIPAVIDEYLAHRVGMEVEGEKLPLPDGVLFKNILNGAQEQMADIDVLIRANSRKAVDGRDIELLLKGILICGTYELMSHQAIDSPLIINDYLNVAHGFYGKSEVGYVNAVLDAVSKALRS